MIAADPADMIHTVRAMIAEHQNEAARLTRELRKLLDATGRRPNPEPLVTPC